MRIEKVKGVLNNRVNYRLNVCVKRESILEDMI